MSSELRRATPDDLDSITRLLQKAFGAAPAAPFLNRSLLHWKYFAPGPDGKNARSYVLEQDGSIVAHGCAWPVNLVFEGRSHSALTLLDWVSERTAPGAGLQLVRKMGSLADIVISIGGSAATRHMMPRIGFRVVEEQTLFARVLRPWRQFRSRPGRASPRDIVRLFRNTGYALTPRRAAGVLLLKRATRLDTSLLADALPRNRPASQRWPAFLDFILECPAAVVTLYSLEDSARSAGYAVLATVHGQCRIAELRLRPPDQENWTATIAAVLDHALQIPEASELVAWASEPGLCRGLESNGFRPRDRRSIFVQDPRGLVPESARFWGLSMLDDDSAFLNIPEYPFAT